MEIYSDHSLEIILCQVSRNELGGCDQLAVGLDTDRQTDRQTELGEGGQFVFRHSLFRQF